MKKNNQSHLNSWRPDGDDILEPFQWVQHLLMCADCMPKHDTWIMFNTLDYEGIWDTPPGDRGPILRNKITMAKGFPCFQRLVEYGAPVVTFPIGRCSPTDELTWRPKKPYNNW